MRPRARARTYTLAFGSMPRSRIAQRAKLGLERFAGLAATDGLQTPVQPTRVALELDGNGRHWFNQSWS